MMIMTHDLLREDWDTNAVYFGENMEKADITQGIAMINALAFEEGVTVLDVGCGTGRLACYLLQNIKVKCTIISIDISEVVIKVANERKSSIVYDQNLIKHEFKVGNAELLTFIENESVDIYFSSQVVHLVVDPDNMVKECHRVLKKKGQFAFSVLGKKEFCTALSLWQDTVVKVGLPAPNKRSIYKYGDTEEALMQLMRDGNLTPQLCWTSYGASNIKDEHEYMKQILSISGSKKAYELLTETQREESFKILTGAFNSLREKCKPLTQEFVICVGIKQ